MSTEEHLDEAVEVERTAASIYGTIVAASVMAAGADHLSVGQICAAVLVTVVVYWAAETYARIVAGRILASEAVSDAVREHARHHWRMVTASYTPLAVLLLASLFGADVSAAVLIALVFTTGLLVVLGWVAAGRAEMTGAPRLVAGAVAGVAGLVMIALKLALH